MNLPPPTTPCCSFCEKPETSVAKLIAGPVCLICDECVEMCVEILNEEGVALHVESRPAAPEVGGGVVLALRTDQIAQSN